MPKLVIAKLKTSASYVQDSEFEASEVDFDTIQWWISDNTSWRIATYSVDNDIRIYSIGKAVSEAFALENTRKHYGDVIDKEIVLDIKDPLNSKKLDIDLKEIGGSKALEFSSEKGFGFWNYDSREYKTISDPPRE